MMLACYQPQSVPKVQSVRLLSCLKHQTRLKKFVSYKRPSLLSRSFSDKEKCFIASASCLKPFFSGCNVPIRLGKFPISSQQVPKKILVTNCRQPLKVKCRHNFQVKFLNVRKVPNNFHQCLYEIPNVRYQLPKANTDVQFQQC